MRSLLLACCTIPVHFGSCRVQCLNISRPIWSGYLGIRKSSFKGTSQRVEGWSPSTPKLIIIFYILSMPNVPMGATNVKPYFSKGQKGVFVFGWNGIPRFVLKWVEVVLLYGAGFWKVLTVGKKSTKTKKLTFVEWIWNCLTAAQKISIVVRTVLILWLLIQPHSIGQLYCNRNYHIKIEYIRYLL